MTTEIVTEKKKVTSRKIQQPKKYKVIVCNDDVTPVDFVISMLVSIFRHTPEQAYDATMAIHNQGSAVVGVYNFEIAEQKTTDGINLARTQGYPLLIKLEEE